MSRPKERLSEYTELASDIRVRTNRTQVGRIPYDARCDLVAAAKSIDELVEIVRNYMRANRELRKEL